MGSSANFYDSTCGIGNNEKCGRAVYGIVYGALATLGAVAIVGLKIATSKAPFLAEILTSFILVVLCGFGVAFITSQVSRLFLLSCTILCAWICVYL